MNKPMKMLNGTDDQVLLIEVLKVIHEKKLFEPDVYFFDNVEVLGDKHVSVAVIIDSNRTLLVINNKALSIIDAYGTIEYSVKNVVYENNRIKIFNNKDYDEHIRIEKTDNGQLDVTWGKS